MIKIALKTYRPDIW